MTGLPQLAPNPNGNSLMQCSRCLNFIEPDDLFRHLKWHGIDPLKLSLHEIIEILGTDTGFDEASFTK